MSDKIGRNEVCPCGSGKKYKKCCIKTSVPDSEIIDFEWRQLRKLEGTVVDKHLMPYVTNELPNELMEIALLDLLPEDLPEAIDQKIFFENFFIPYFLFNWICTEDIAIDGFNLDKTIAENYLTLHDYQLSNRERQFIVAMAKTYYSFYSVLEVEYECSLTIKDILLGTTHIVKERQGTHYLKRGDIVFSRVLTMDDQSIFIGMAPFIIPTHYHHHLINFKKWLFEELEQEALTPESLKAEIDLDVLECFFDITIAAFNKPMPTLANTDGDLFQFCYSYFKLLITPEEALKQLLPLTLSDNLESFIEEAERNASGDIQSIALKWLKKGNKKHSEWEVTALGDITLESGKLRLETNSEKRAEKGKKLIKKYLGESVIFQNTLIESLNSKMESMPALTKENKKMQNNLMELPEIQEHLESMAKAHWQAWFTQPIPALDNQTPRQAVQTVDGREKLEALLLQYERYDIGRKANDPFKANIQYLREELALDKA